MSALCWKGLAAYLDGDLAVVEVDDCDVAILLCLCVAIVTGSGILGKHVQSGAFDFYDYRSLRGERLLTFGRGVAALDWGGIRGLGGRL